MALTQRLEFRQSQSLVMTPQLMQAIKLLQLSNLDLSAFVEEELERNPLLDRASDGPEAPVAGEPAAERAEFSDSGSYGDEGGETSDLASGSAGDAFEPGQEDSSHSHTGPVFGYVLEGEYEHAIDDEPVKTYKAGDTFYEPSGSVHRVARNPSGKTRTRLLAVVLHSRYTKETTVPEKGKE